MPWDIVSFIVQLLYFSKLLMFISGPYHPSPPPISILSNCSNCS